MTNRIYLSSPHMGGNELAYVEEAFSTNWVAPMGPNIPLFEDSIVRFTGARKSVALASGTAAIHLALMVLGINEGDEVLCSSFTFAATVNPIMYLKATPILIDSEPDTWNMCPKALEEAIEDRIRLGKKPKAIIVVHLYGMPAKMTEIMALSERFEIPVIEDAAEALGSTYMGRPVGTLGALGVYSFNGNKIITTSGGGALVSDDKSLIERAKFLATQARDEAPYYQHSEIGYNYRMSNIAAGIGCGQMEVLPEWIKRRRANFDFYRSSLAEFPDIELLTEPEGFYSNRWLSCILLTESIGFHTVEALRVYLESQNIETRPLWKPMQLQPVFKDLPYYGSGLSEKLFLRGICLPSGSNLSPLELEFIAEHLRAFLEKKYVRFRVS